MTECEKKKCLLCRNVILGFFVCFLIFVSGQISGVFVYRQYMKNYWHHDRVEVRAKSSEFQFINPLLECSGSEDEFEFSEGKPSKSRLISLIDQARKDGRIESAAVYFRDLNNGPWIGINEREWFAPASLLKVPLSMMLYRAKDSDPNYFSKELTLESSGGVVSANFGETGRLQVGSRYPLQALIDRMLIDSDNDAAFTVMEQAMSLERVSSLYQDLNIEVIKNEAGDEGIAVKDYSALFRILFNASYLSKESSEEILKILSQSSFKDALVAGLPSGITVSHKFGERDIGGIKQLHDCGIVYVPGRPYLLCVMTKGSSFEELAKVIADISKSIYGDILLSQRKTD